MSLIPLAERVRPKNLDEVVGQRHLLDNDKPLRRIINSGKIPNMIFYGPSGVGKTTVARIIAEKANMRLHKLNGTSASTADVKSVISEIDSLLGADGILLYLDEIQYLNKKQQQSLLEHIENGNITLIASTTENPYFYIYNAILSRSTVFEFKPIEADEVIRAVRRGFDSLAAEYGEKAQFVDNADALLASSCGGDVRKAMNAVELCFLSADIENGERIISPSLVNELAQKSAMKYDRDGDQHYEVLSALQKSIRGSDENAALHYLARLLESGDLLSACRRLMVIACEDIGLAYPQAIPIVKACCDIAVQVGLPEASLPLSDAAVLLATSPKSNSAHEGYIKAAADLRRGVHEVPKHLQNAHYESETKKLSGADGYLYPHNFLNHYVNQQYLPDDLKDRIYYEFGDNKNEQAALLYRQKIKNEAEK